MVRQITEDHGSKTAGNEKILGEIPEEHGKECVIGQIDGSMVPIIEIAEAAEHDQSLDRRKYRELCWKASVAGACLPQMVHEPFL